MPGLHQLAPEGCRSTMSRIPAFSGGLRHPKDPQMTQDISVYATELRSQGGTKIPKQSYLM